MRITWPTAIVLAALEAGHPWGFQIIDVTGLRAGTVYPILRRLEADGMVRSSWEKVARARAEARPPRRNYRLTASGWEVVAAAHARYPTLGRLFSATGEEGAQPA